MGAKSDAHHIIPFKTYLTVLIILLTFTVITVAAAQVDFGPFNALIAMAIASFKACLVLLYFMHLKYDDKLFPAVFFTGVFFLVVFFSFSQLDIVTRILPLDPIK